MQRIGHGEIVRINAILNGTVNFLFERLAHGEMGDAALKHARAARFAE